MLPSVVIAKRFRKTSAAHQISLTFREECLELSLIFLLPPEEHPFGGALATLAFKAAGESRVVHIYLWMEVEAESGRAPVDFLALRLRAWWVRMASAF